MSGADMVRSNSRMKFQADDSGTVKKAGVTAL